MNKKVTKKFQKIKPLKKKKRKLRIKNQLIIMIMMYLLLVGDQQAYLLL